MKQILEKGLRRSFATPNPFEICLNQLNRLYCSNLSYIPLSVINQGHYGQWFGSFDVGIVMAAMSNDGLVTVDTGGCIRLWETSLAHLDKSMQTWRGMIGDLENEQLKVRSGEGHKVKRSKECRNRKEKSKMSRKCGNWITNVLMESHRW